MCNGVAARISTDAFETAAARWHAVLGSKFTTFMCNSVASRIGTDAFETAAERWHAVLGSHNFSRTFAISGFANRITTPAFERRVTKHVHRLVCRYALYAFLRQNAGRKMATI